MSVVKAERLNDFMSNPAWSAEQELEAQRVLDEVEDSLAAALWHTKITPEPFVETCPVLRSGMVATRYPISAVLAIGGVAVAEGAPLPAGYRLFEHRLYTRIPNRSMPIVSGPIGLRAVDAFWATGELGGSGGGSIELSYMAGWGPRPALVEAILRKAKGLFLDNHDDSMMARGTDATPPPATGAAGWTDEELAPLGIFRNLSGGA